ncbi:transposase, mutator type [Bifidobacterium pullorum]|uniref:Transposase, mutator type n=1 Tax=Bifidobacterium pullorum TaxID=78448 RepID=A0A7V8HQ57_9BIFI|nr:transposase, mutator type [Bifidobacterium pullorum]
MTNHNLLIDVIGTDVDPFLSLKVEQTTDAMLNAATNEIKFEARHERACSGKVCYAGCYEWSLIVKTKIVAVEKESMTLKTAASCLQECIDGTTIYLLDDYSAKYWRSIRAYNMIERSDSASCRACIVGSFLMSKALLYSHARVFDMSLPTNGQIDINSTCPGSVHHTDDRLKTSRRQDDRIRVKHHTRTR